INGKSFRRLVITPLNVMLVFLLTAVAPQQAFGPPSTQAGHPAASAQPTQGPLDLFKVPDGFEVTLWASSPMLHNPTDIDIDRDGRIWVAKGVLYRPHTAAHPEGTRT